MNAKGLLIYFCYTNYKENFSLSSLIYQALGTVSDNSARLVRFSVHSIQHTYRKIKIICRNLTLVYEEAKFV